MLRIQNTMHSNATDQGTHSYDGELFARCVEEVMRNIQTPEALVACTALAAISTSLQGTIDVEWPDGRVSPTSLYTLIRGKSGERKSSVFNRLFSGIICFQQKEMDKYKISYEEYKKRNALWLKKRDGVLKKIATFTAKGSDTSELEKIYLEIESEKPENPKKLSILYDDATPEALVYGMSEDCKYAALVSSEGGSILKSGAFRAYAKLNELWSGGTVKTDRKTSDSSFVENGRLSICIMVQPEIHDHYLSKEENDQLKGSGLWARFLVSEPASTIGTRQIGAGKTCWEHSERFAKRLTVFLNEMNQTFLGKKRRHTVKMSLHARTIFLECANYIEFQCRPGCRFYRFEDHASKLPENILRIAALLQTFEYGIGSHITAEIMKHSINIAFDLSDQFKRIFYVPTEEEMEDREILEWIEDKKVHGHRYLRKNYIQKYGPSRLRRKARLDPCLVRMEQSGLVRKIILGGIQAVDLMPHFNFDYCAAVSAIRANYRRY